MLDEVAGRNEAVSETPSNEAGEGTRGKKPVFTLK